MRNSIISGLVFLIISILSSSAAFAYTVTVDLTFFDTQSDRFTGSYLDNTTDNSNNPLRDAKVYLLDQDGCNDYAVNCNENNDDLLGMLTPVRQGRPISTT